MYVLDDIAYSNEYNSENLKIVSFKVVSELCMLVTFSNGEKKIFDAKYLISYPAYKSLEDFDIFSNAKIENGILVWDNGKIDIGVYEVYNNSFVYEQAKVASGEFDILRSDKVNLTCNEPSYNKYIQKAEDEFEYLTGDAAERRLAELREKAIRDEVAGLISAERKGMQQEKKQTAKKMLAKGLDIETIIEITGLTKEEIQKIK